MGRFSNAWDALFAKELPSSPFGNELWSQISRSGRPPVRGTGELLAAYSNMPRLRSVVDRISTAVASTAWRAFRIPRASRRFELSTYVRSKGPLHRTKLLHQLRSDGELIPLNDHPVLDLLMSPNPMLTARQTFELTQTHLDLVGETFWVIEKGKERKEPFEIWPIPPNWVRDLPSKETPFYRIAGPGYTPPLIPEDNVIWIKRPDPKNPYGRGSGIGNTLDNELSADEYAAQTISSRFWNQAIPPHIVSLKNVNKDQLTAFRESWLQQHRGFKKVAVPHMTNAEIDVKTLSASFVDDDVVNLRRFEADVIRETYGVPPEILGDAKDSNRATITSAQFLFALLVQVPRLNLLEDFLNIRLLPMFEDSDIVLLYDNPVPEDREFQLKAAEEVPWILNIDEWRELAGQAPLGGEAGIKHILPSDMLPVDLETFSAEDMMAIGNQSGSGHEEDKDKHAKSGIFTTTVPKNGTSNGEQRTIPANINE